MKFRFGELSRSLAELFFACTLAACFWPLNKSIFVVIFAVSALTVLAHNRIRRQYILDSFLILVGGLFLFSSISTKTSEVHWTTTEPVGFYNEITDSFLSGQLHLKEKVDSRLIALSDPYPPENRTSDMYNYDASYFNGKYYIYWGIAPVLTICLPFRMLTGKFIGEVSLTLILALLTLIAGYFSILKVLHLVQENEPTFLQRFLAFIGILFSGSLAVATRHPIIYETAILSGLGFFFASVFLAIPGKRESTKVSHAFLSGLLFSLAIASRATYALSIIFFIAVYFDRRNMKALKNFIIGATPILTIVLVYNFLRFQNPFEFGLHYQLNTLDMRNWGPEWRDIYFSLSAYLTQAPVLKNEFPFVSFHPYSWSFDPYKHRYSNEGAYGLLYIAPVVILAIISQFHRQEVSRAKVILWSLFAVGLGFLLIDCAAGVSVRYQMEIYSLLLIPSLAIALSFQRRRWLVLATIVFGVNLGYFASFTFVKDGFLPVVKKYVLDI